LWSLPFPGSLPDVKPLWSYKLANWNFLLIAVGTFIYWAVGFIAHYATLYTLYWPLPADFSQFNPLGGAIFILGIALIMLGTVFFVINVFKTIVYRSEGWEKQPSGALLASALGVSGAENIFRKRKREHLVPLPVAAIARGTVDVALNSGIILFKGVLILVYMVAAVLGHSLEKTAVDALLYKNWFWWGLDLIADGLVLIFVAGTWYLLAIMITQGLAFFIVLATLWSARPLKMTNELKFLLGGLLGFALAVPAGIMQADVGLNRILHNTQWIVGPHVHVAVLVGLTMTLYAAVYILFPILTNGAKFYSQKLANVHFWCHLIGGIGMGAFMGMAGLQGMLRRTLYVDGEFNTLMILAALSGSPILIAFLAFFYPFIITLLHRL
jgi:cytochrome c oxidase subunit 1